MVACLLFAAQVFGQPSEFRVTLGEQKIPAMAIAQDIQPVMFNLVVPGNSDETVHVTLWHDLSGTHYLVEPRATERRKLDGVFADPIVTLELPAIKRGAKAMPSIPIVIEWHALPLP